MDQDVRHLLAEAMGLFLARLGYETDTTPSNVPLQTILDEFDEQVSLVPMETIELAILNLLQKLQPVSGVLEQESSTTNLRMYLGPFNQRVRALMVQALGTYVARVWYGNPTYTATHTMMDIVHHSILSTPFDVVESSLLQMIIELLPPSRTTDTDPVLDIGINDVKPPGEPDIIVLTLPKIPFTGASNESQLPGLNNSSDGCVICTEDFTIGDLTLNLFCDHTFHADCITEWSRHGHNCPLCRKPFDLASY